MTTKKPDSYVERLPCGCLVAWCADNPEHQRDVARSVAKFIRNGYSVEHVVLDDVRDQLGPCKCQNKLSFSESEKLKYEAAMAARNAGPHNSIP